MNEREREREREREKYVHLEQTSRRERDTNIQSKRARKRERERRVWNAKGIRAKTREREKRITQDEQLRERERRACTRAEIYKERERERERDGERRERSIWMAPRLSTQSRAPRNGQLNPLAYSEQRKRSCPLCPGETRRGNAMLGRFSFFFFSFFHAAPDAVSFLTAAVVQIAGVSSFPREISAGLRRKKEGKGEKEEKEEK